MNKLPEERFCPSVRNKRSQSTPVDQGENEGRQYRTLLSIFANNANAFLKQHRDCFVPTDHYAKIKASREEQHAVCEQLDRIYQKMEDKIVKEAICRNAQARKFIEEYAEAYRASFPETQTMMVSSQEVKPQEHSLEKQPSKPSFSERKRATITPPRRPLSSKEPKNVRSSLFSQVHNQFQSNQFSQTYKVKTISAHTNQNPERKNQKETATSNMKLSRMPSKAKKTVLTLKNRYDDFQSQKQRQYEEFLFNGNPDDARQQYESNSAMAGRPSAKRLINLKFSQRKSIIQLQKLHIQNRIMMISSVLSVNLVQPQGYRPRSRCWQNYFN